MIFWWKLSIVAEPRNPRLAAMAPVLLFNMKMLMLSESYLEFTKLYVTPAVNRQPGFRREDSENMNLA